VPHLESAEGAGADQPGFPRAALWVLVGLSRHALGDAEGTQEALEAAVRAAPDGVSEGCPERITALAGPAAHELLAAAERMSPASAERVALLRMAVLWLEWRIVAAPATKEVSELLDNARETLWEGYALAGAACFSGGSSPTPVVSFARLSTPRICPRPGAVRCLPSPPRAW
jgi:hypothetical protein